VQTEPDVTTRIGGWLFRHRSSIPLPFVLAILVIPGSDAWRSSLVLGLGVVVTLAGEALRLWGVHHIGVISRTRSDRLGPLVDTGPFGFVRNPLYIGNILLWIGFAVTARLVWMAPVVLVLLGAEYHAIVRWEEQLLEAKRGQEYRDYRSRVPRWLPTFQHRGHQGHKDQKVLVSSVSMVSSSFSFRETLFSERGTLLAIAAGYVLLWIKLKV
jgi:protein-S-isoprenylcysteine O-methyltransferase Ste14